MPGHKLGKDLKTVPHSEQHNTTHKSVTTRKILTERENKNFPKLKVEKKIN